MRKGLFLILATLLPALSIHAQEPPNGSLRWAWLTLVINPRILSL